MRDSFSELAKLLIPPNKRDQYDLYNLNRTQMQVKARGEMLKYIRGIVTLADWLAAEYEDGASLSMLIEYIVERDRLYKKLNWCHYTWDAKKRLWRLMRRFKTARHIRPEED
jgi:hypothetical protein